MSTNVYVTVDPTVIVNVAIDLENVGNILNDASLSVEVATTTIVAAGLDQISQEVATLFNSWGRDWQQLASAASAFHQGFTSNLLGSAISYQSTDKLHGKE